MPNPKKSYTPSLEYRLATSTPVGRFIRGAAWGAYHAITFPLRVATSTRNGIDWSKSVKAKENGANAEESGVVIGAVQGAPLLYWTTKYALNAVQDGNYLPAAVLATTNLVSLGFELGRLSKNK